MDSTKVNTFMQLAGQARASSLSTGSVEQRLLGAQLLLSEVLEYVVHGLGVVPVFNGTAISEPNQLRYQPATAAPDRPEMVDGLCDVAYTMYWNALAFGVPLEAAFDVVCDNNLTKFVRLKPGEFPLGPVAAPGWGLQREIVWPPEVVSVEVVSVSGALWAVGKDATGKVRKPSSYRPVDLSSFVGKAG